MRRERITRWDSRDLKKLFNNVFRRDNQCGKCAVHLQTACKTAFHCKLSYVWQSCNTILCSTSALVHAFGHLNQISFLRFNVGTFIGCSLVTLTVTGHPSMLLVLTVNSEFACLNTNPKMSLSFSDKAAHSAPNGEELLKH